MGKKDTVHIDNGILLSHKKSEIGSFVIMWMNVESVIQSKSEREKEIYINAYIWNLEK